MTRIKTTTRARIGNWLLRVLYCHHNARVLVDTEHRLTCLLDHATGGVLSRPHYPLVTMQDFIDHAREREIAEAEKEAVLEAMSDAERKVILAMNDEMAFSFASIGADTEVPPESVRDVVRVFRLRGLADYGVLTDEDTGAICGRGYWLTSEGMKLRADVEDYTA